MTRFENRIYVPDSDTFLLDEAWHYGCTGRSVQALSIATSVVESAAHRGDRRILARGSQESAWYCFQLGRPEQGIEFAGKAVEIWRLLDEPGLEAQALSIHAWLNTEIGDLELAVELAAEALNLADQSGNLRSRSLAINVIGVIFWLSRQPRLAIDYCGRAVELAREAQDLSFECWWLINLGGSHAEAAYLAREMDDRRAFEAAIDEAVVFTNQAYDLAQTLKDAWAERLCLGNLAEYLNAVDDFVGAEEHLARYRAITDGEDVRSEGHYLDILGRTLISLQRYEEALVPLQHAHRLATESTNIDTLMFSCLYLSKAHEKLGAFQSALDFHKKYHRLHQQFTAERTQQNARMAEIRYETKKLKALLDNEAERSASIERSLAALQQRTNVLAEAANTDPLTGLFNRRRLDSALIEIGISQQHYALAIIDVDHFKKVNDTFSHVVGDKVLVQIGQLIKAFARETDLAVRFGGEEFVVLMAGVTRAQADKASGRLLKRIAAYNWSQIAEQLEVTVSIGVAMSVDAPDPESVIKLADQHLYIAKQTGRNKVVFAASQSGC